MKHPTKFEMILEICKKLNIKVEDTKLPKFDFCGEIFIEEQWHQIYSWWVLKSTIKEIHKKIVEIK